MAYLDAQLNVPAISEQVRAAEDRARQLEARLEEAKRANEHAEVHIGDLSAERNALALRVDELEKKASLIVAGQPEAIVKGLTGWLKTDDRHLVAALTKFLREAMQ